NSIDLLSALYHEVEPTLKINRTIPKYYNQLYNEIDPDSKHIRLIYSSTSSIKSSPYFPSALYLRTSSPSLWVTVYLFILFAALIFSIYIGAVAVAGTVPHIVQKIANQPDCDIYEQAGGIPKGRLATQKLGKLCLLQAHLFVGVLALFAIYVLFFYSPTA
ncbi:MAG: hypothetical protein HC889_14715, partial [Synechococcaceae cyanobacterium SM1_2_3]|nr:hypothetical protein [Synechococcaceae cyanobacterium SM1_2_3]